MSNLYTRDLRNILKAIKAAECSEHPKWRVGAAVIRHSDVSLGCNSLRGEPSSEYFAPTYHAEEVALRQASNGGRDATCYVARLSKKGKLRLARPCDGCYASLVDSKVKRIVYTTNNGLKGEKL